MVRGNYLLYFFLESSMTSDLFLSTPCRSRIHRNATIRRQRALLTVNVNLGELTKCQTTMKASVPLTNLAYRYRRSVLVVTFRFSNVPETRRHHVKEMILSGSTS